jgi:hypothetical protein
MSLEEAVKRFGPGTDLKVGEKSFEVWGTRPPNLGRHERYHLDIRFLDGKAKEYKVWNEHWTEMPWQSTAH